MQVKVHCSERMWANLTSFLTISAEGWIHNDTRHKIPVSAPSPPPLGPLSDCLWSWDMVSQISGRLRFLVPCLGQTPSRFNPSLSTAFGPGLLLLATLLLFQTTVPSRGFRTRWGFRKSLRQLVRAARRETEQPFPPSVVSARKNLATICRFVLPTNCSSPGSLSH